LFPELFCLYWLLFAEPVGTVDKPSTFFGLGLSKQLWEKAAQRFAFFHSCGSFHRLPLPNVFCFFLVKSDLVQEKLRARIAYKRRSLTLPP